VGIFTLLHPGEPRRKLAVLVLQLPVRLGKLFEACADSPDPEEGEQGKTDARGGQK
jgi:hypothetical protein